MTAPLPGSAGRRLAPERAARLAALEREAGRRVVLTNGCFDLLHDGHRHLLRRARAEGDVLFVAVNDDASVRRLKGPGRPRRPLARRVADLAAVAAVDWIVAFAADTPEALVRAIAPDVLVKGDDWAADAIVGRAFVEARGGRVVRVPRLPGLSTTRALRGGDAPAG